MNYVNTEINIDIHFNFSSQPWNNVLRTAQNLGGEADSIENYLSKIWGAGAPPPKLAGGKPHGVNIAGGITQVECSGNPY